MRLFVHVPHPHKPRNVNVLHKAEQQTLNAKIAVFLTRSVGSMWCAYFFAFLAFIGLLGLLGLLNPFTFLMASWASQQFVQLVLLPVIMVGQNVLNRKQELQAEEQFCTTVKSYHDIEQIMQHLDIQDQKILEATEKLELLLEGVKHAE